MRYRDAGGWHDLDLEIVSGPDGRLQPAAAPSAATLAPDTAPGRDVASLGTRAGSIGLRHPGANPAHARADGPKAIYPGALGRRDLVLELLPDGVEESVVVPDAAAGPTYGDELVLPPGLSARQGPSGIEVLDGAGAVVARFGSALAHDAAGGGAAGGGAARVGVSLRIASTTSSPGGGSVVTVEVGVDAGWLADPHRVFPVTIDPTLSYLSSDTASSGFDTLVWQGTPTAGYPSYGYLETGYWNPAIAPPGGITRSYLRWNLGVAPASNLWVTESHVNIYNYGALDCLYRSVSVKGLTTPFDAATTWNNQPGVEAGVVSSTGTNKGGSSACPSGFINLDATTLARRWLRGDTPNNGLQLAAADEADYYGAKDYFSAEGPAGNAPKLYVTYSRLPSMATPAAPADNAVFMTTTPTLSVNPATDPDGDPVSYWFRGTATGDSETGSQDIDSGWVSSPPTPPAPASWPTASPTAGTCGAPTTPGCGTPTTPTPPRSPPPTGAGTSA